MRLSEGTISYLIGCHQFFLHPLWVLVAWIKEYRSLPKFWELCCIFLHDIGHIGKDYLSDSKQKAEHWILGAKIARLLFGEKGFLLIAGHVTKSPYPRSKLYLPDKRSWLEAPDWWLLSNSLIEDFETNASLPKNWKRLVRENIENGCPKGSHELYLENKGKDL